MIEQRVGDVLLDNKGFIFIVFYFSDSVFYVLHGVGALNPLTSV